MTSAAAAAFSLEKALRALPEPGFSIVGDRIRMLERELDTTYDTKLRDDSRLAYEWASGNLAPGFRFEDVVFELLLMRYLFDFTEYQKVLSQLISGWEHTPITTATLRDWIIPLAKVRTLQKQGLPKQWPWLMKKMSG